MIGAILAKKNVRSAFDALSLQNLDAFLNYWADQAIFLCPGPSGPGFAEQVVRIEGKEAIRGWFEAFVGQWEYATFMVKNVSVKRMCPLAVGDNVIMVEWDLLLKSRDMAKDINTSGVAVIDVTNGKAIEVRVYECLGNPLFLSEGFMTGEA